MSKRLSQVLAVEKGVKADVYGQITALHKAAQKPQLFDGLQRHYEPKTDGDEKFPSEGQRVQFRAKEVLNTVARLSVDLFTVIAQKDWTNCAAKGTIELDGTVILRDVPATHLLFLEKQLSDLHTLVSVMPQLSEAEDWTYDANTGLFKTAETKTHKTKKLPKAIVKYPATEQHPAQTEMVTEDQLVGFWNQTKQSGAMPGPDKQDLLVRIDRLRRAVMEAREEANTEVVGIVPDVGAAIFGHLFPQ